MKKPHQRGAIDILDEAVFLLRSASAATVVTYLIGAVPFQLALLFFLMDMAHSPYAFDYLTLGSLGLAVLYMWKNAWQAAFMAKLYEMLSPGDAKDARTRLPWRMILMQCALQPLGLIVPLPFPWLVAFFRNVALFAALGREDAVRAAGWQAVRASRQNWGVLSITAVAGLVLLANVMIMIFAVPQLGRSFLGIEGDFARSISAMLNVTTFGVALSITWLAVDPLLDAVYVLRCFYGESVATGEDLSAAFKKAVATAALAVLVLIVGLIATPRTAHAQPVALGNETRSIETRSIDPGRLDRAIDEVVHRREFTWREARKLNDAPQWYSGVVKMADQAGAAIRKGWRRFTNWLHDLFSQKPLRTEGGNGSPVTKRVMQALIAVILALVVGAVVFFLRRPRTRVVTAQAVQATAPKVDLADESLTADQLPESSWLALAEEWLAKGDCRLALRALYLAGLNYLGQHELVSVRRWKSGLDYRREVERRSRTKPEIAPAFTSSVAIFEQGWYGKYADRPMVESLAARLQEMRKYAQRA